MQTNRKPGRPGIEERHRKGCATTEGRRCKCTPSYRAEVYSARDGRKLRKTFATPAEAKEWRHDTERGLQQGRLLAVRPITFRQASKQFLAGARDGSIRNRSGDEYKPGQTRLSPAPAAAPRHRPPPPAARSQPRPAYRPDPALISGACA